jgi:hypothetical protein
MKIAGETSQTVPQAQAETEATVKAQIEAEAAAKGQAEVEAAAKAQAKTEETTRVSLRHTTPYRVYRRAGLVLTQMPGEYQVTDAQLATLTADTWVEVIEG